MAQLYRGKNLRRTGVYAVIHEDSEQIFNKDISSKLALSAVFCINGYVVV